MENCVETEYEKVLYLFKWYAMPRPHDSYVTMDMAELVFMLHANLNLWMYSVMIHWSIYTLLI